MSEFTRPNPHRWRILAVSCAATFTIFSVFTYEGGKGEPQPPEVTYITSWAADRTNAEIVATNILNQKRKDEYQAELDAFAEQQKDIYKTLGAATFIDVDTIEKQAVADEAAEAAAKAKRAAAATPPAKAAPVEAAK